MLEEEQASFRAWITSLGAVPAILTQTKAEDLRQAELKRADNCSRCRRARSRPWNDYARHRVEAAPRPHVAFARRGVDGRQEEHAVGAQTWKRASERRRSSNAWPGEVRGSVWARR